MANLSISLAQLERALARIAGVEVKAGVSTASFTSMAVGGPADLAVEVSNAAALAKTIEILNQSQSPWMMLGGGSNTIFGDEGYRGTVVRLKGELTKIEVDADKNLIHAGAGANLGALMKAAQRAGLAGLEFGQGIPGTLGGALAGNSGAGGEDICSAASYVEVLAENGETERLVRGEFSFGYRKSDLCGRVIVGATLSLRTDTAEAIAGRMNAHLNKRLKQPLREHSAGCMFKNPEGDHAGRLIDAAKLKRAQVGGISVSDIHANFMINAGSGTAADIVALLKLVETKVYEDSGVRLETEVRVIGSANDF